MLQRGQQGSVSVSFVKPVNGSVWPLDSSSGHVTHVPVQLQILNMWFEGERLPMLQISYGFYFLFILNSAPPSHRKQAPILCECGCRQAHFILPNETQNP